jgi:hypothetical protein
MEDEIRGKVKAAKKQYEERRRAAPKVLSLLDAAPKGRRASRPALELRPLASFLLKALDIFY